MAKEIKDDVAPVAPVLVADKSKLNTDLLVGSPAPVEHNPKEYLLTGPDGKDFNVNPNTYTRYFKEDKDFTVKKSPTKP